MLSHTARAFAHTAKIASSRWTAAPALTANFPLNTLHNNNNNNNNNTTSTTTTISRSMATLEESQTAKSAWEQSCYFQMDFSISEDATVYEAVQKFAAYDVGCLVTTDANGAISGVISERDYVSKIALLGRKSKETAIKEISTKTANLVTATPKESVDECMQKMLQRDIRHLPLLDDGGKVIGMLSVKDLVKTLVQEKEDTIKVLSDFALGKGGHFGSE